MSGYYVFNYGGDLAIGTWILVVFIDIFFLVKNRTDKNPKKLKLRFLSDEDLVILENAKNPKNRKKGDQLYYHQYS
jgi:hypothetical protein